MKVFNKNKYLLDMLRNEPTEISKGIVVEIVRNPGYWANIADGLTEEQLKEKNLTYMEEWMEEVPKKKKRKTFSQICNDFFGGGKSAKG